MKLDNQTELLVTLALFVVELGLLALCFRRLHQPVNPLKPRMLPYSGLTILLVVLVLATAAHAFALYAGVKFAFGGNPGAPPPSPK
jgi:hypothetical protein